MPVAGGGVQAQKLNYDQLSQLFANLMAAKAAKVAEQGDADQAVKDAQQALNEYVKEKLPGISANDLAGLITGVSSMDVMLRQINVNPSGAKINYLGGVGLVDRCQSCHMGMDPLVVPVTMTLTKADLKLANNNDAPFTSHPDPDLMKYHPLEKFGCSPCHGGNGRALDTVESAHGRYEHWLWPLYYKENYEAGCQQCHASDMVTEHAPVLNPGARALPHQGLRRLPPVSGLRQSGRTARLHAPADSSTRRRKKRGPARNPRLNKQGDLASDNDAAARFYQQATNLTVDDQPDGRARGGARAVLAQLAAGDQESRAGPERSPHEVAPGMDPVLARRRRRLPPCDEDAAVPLAAG